MVGVFFLYLSKDTGPGFFSISPEIRSIPNVEGDIHRSRNYRKCQKNVDDPQNWLDDELLKLDVETHFSGYSPSQWSYDKRK